MAGEFTERKVRGEEEILDIRVYEAAICFARMWGVMETLEPLPNLGFEGVREIVVMLAEEFVSGKGEDLVVFFTERAGDLKRKHSLQAALKKT